MYKLGICVQQSGYSAKLGDDTDMINLGGGLGRTYIATKRNAHNVNVNWVLTELQFQSLMAFWRLYQYSPDPFLIDLIIDSPELEEFQALFIPNTFNLDEKNGLTFKVSAQLQVKKLKRDLNMDEIIVIGGDLSWVNELDELVNVALPNALGVSNG